MLLAMSVDDLKILDIHYCILIKRYGSKKALDIMKKILPKNYEHEIELDENNITGYDEMKENHYNGKNQEFKMQLGHCRNKWSIEKQIGYLEIEYRITRNPIYLRIRQYEEDNFMSMVRYNFSNTGIEFREIDVSVEDEYMKLIGED